MTHFFASPLALPFALALALTAGGLAALPGKAQASEAPSTSVRCFMGANADSRHGVSNGGWVCITEHRDSNAR